MSSFAEFNPIADTTRVIKFVRFDNNFRLTIGKDTSGTVTYHYFNFTGIPNNYQYRPTSQHADAEFIEFAQLVKEGNDESLTVRIKMYYNENDNTLEDHQIPQAWSYADTINKDNYKPGTFFTGTQTIPVVIWRTLDPSVQVPATSSNTAAAPSVFSGLRTFQILGSATARQEYLRTKLSNIVFGDLFFTLNEDSSPTASTHKAIIRFYENLTRLISIPANLDNERKFNMLNGIINLDVYDVSTYLNFGTINRSNYLGNNNRSNWLAILLGGITAAAPYTYSSPSSNTRHGWQPFFQSNISGLNIVTTGIPSIITDRKSGWLNWLRS